MENEQISKSTDTPAVAADSETQMFFEGTSERFYVTISELVEGDNLEDGCECLGAVDIGELTRLQYAIFRQGFSKIYRGQSVVGFQSHRTPSNVDDTQSRADAMSLAVVLDNYDFLTDDQRKALDTALRIANQVRTADGCGHKNIVRQKWKKKDENADNPAGEGSTGGVGSKKYEDAVQSIIDINVPEVVAGKAEPLLQKDIVSKLKNEWDNFKGDNVSTITKGVSRTLAWKNYDEYLQEEWKKVNIGETYVKRKKGGKRRGRVGSSMESYADVNSDGDGDD